MGQVTATDVSWSVRRTTILDQVDLAALDGQVVGLLGPNGSGKSSLLRLLAGLREPAHGVVRLDGTDVHEMSRRAVARRLAVVEQEVEANGDLTVRQVVELGRTPFRGRFDALTPEDRRLVDDALTRTNMTSRQHQAWHTLSGGERQRAQVARALAQQPTELILDEPTNHLDIRHQLELLDLLRELGQLGTTCVIALHDLNVAARYCDYVVLLDGGTVVTAGSPAEVLTPELIAAVYGVEALVDHELAGDVPRITFLAPIRTS